jgi:hypothetical protein
MSPFLLIKIWNHYLVHRVGEALVAHPVAEAFVAVRPAVVPFFVEVVAVFD